MPFARPTLAELVARAKSDLRGRLSLAGSLLRRAMADVLGTVWAGAVHELYGFLEWVARQSFADAMDADRVPNAASLWNLSLTPASYASGSVTATGVDGSVIPATSTYLVRGDGLRYQVTADATISGGTATVAVTAVTAGSDSNCDAAGTLSFESPITGVDPTASVAAGGVSGGSDQEDPEGLRARWLLLLREPPEGGSDADYKGWALSVAGVTRAWVYRWENGLGTVVVRFVRDNDASIFPDSGEVAAVQAKLDAERPTTAEVTAAAPVALPVNISIHISPDTSALRDAVTAELADLLSREAEPGDGAGRGSIPLSHFRTAIGLALDDGDYALASPSADVVPALGELAILGTVSFT